MFQLVYDGGGDSRAFDVPSLVAHILRGMPIMESESVLDGDD